MHSREHAHQYAFFIARDAARIQVRHLHIKSRWTGASISQERQFLYAREPIDLLKIKTAEPFLLPGSLRAQKRYIALIRVKEVHYISTAPAKHPLYYFIILFFAHTILLLNTHKNVSHMHFKRAACMHRQRDLAFLCFFVFAKGCYCYTCVLNTRAQFFSGACEIATQTNIYSTQM